MKHSATVRSAPFSARPDPGRVAVLGLAPMPFTPTRAGLSRVEVDSAILSIDVVGVAGFDASNDMAAVGAGSDLSPFAEMGGWLAKVASDTSEEALPLLESMDFEHDAPSDLLRAVSSLGPDADQLVGFVHSCVASRIRFAAGEFGQLSGDVDLSTEDALRMAELTSLHFSDLAVVDWIDSLEMSGDWWDCAADELQALYKSAPTNFVRGLIAGAASRRLVQATM